MKLLFTILCFVGLVFAKVDINTASKLELMSLSGVGAKKADAIIEYRENRCFKSSYEISNVKGIGEKSFEKFKDKIEVSKCEEKK